MTGAPELFVGGLDDLLSKGPIDYCTAIGGFFAVICGLFLAWSIYAMGPAVRGFPCAPPFLRVPGMLTAGGFFWRGWSLLNSCYGLGPDVRHAHADLAVSWVLSAWFFGSVLAFILLQRMDPVVRAGLDRRNVERRRMVLGLLNLGDVHGARLVASGHGSGEAEAYRVGASPETVRQLSEMA